MTNFEMFTNSKNIIDNLIFIGIHKIEKTVYKSNVKMRIHFSHFEKDIIYIMIFFIQIYNFVLNNLSFVSISKFSLLSFYFVKILKIIKIFYLQVNSQIKK